MKKLAVVLLIALAGCTTTEQANSALASRFKGGAADSFFLAYGPPTSSYKLASGGTLYTWAESAKTYNMPGHANTSFVGNQAFTTYTPGSSYNVQCTLKIAVDAKGVIQQIDVLSDTMGDWQMSRCNEVFGKKA
jgi:hypothetical protein